MYETLNAETIRAEEFPVVARHAWFNHAAISPWPAVVAQAVQDYLDESRHGPLAYARWLEIEARLRQRASRLLGREDGDEVALVANTSTGLNLVARGLAWKTGDNVVFPGNDFPSNRLPWQALEAHGVEPRAVRLDPTDPEASLIDAMGPGTRLLAVASVQYDNGYRFDLERLGAACRRRGALFCIDAIQQLGALALEADAVAADFVVAGSHKWLMAPEGLALFWSRPEAREQLAVTTPGWRMFADPFNFGRSDWRPGDSARRFEPGTLNMASIHGLDAALGLLLDQGIGSIEKALIERTRYLSSELQTLPGLSIKSPTANDRMSGIVSFELARLDSESIVAHLTAENIHAAARGPMVRLSPHFYTPPEHLVKIIRVLSEFDRD